VLLFESGKWIWHPVDLMTFLILLPALPMMCECSVWQISIFSVTCSSWITTFTAEMIVNRGSIILPLCYICCKQWTTKKKTSNCIAHTMLLYHHWKYWTVIGWKWVMWLTIRTYIRKYCFISIIVNQLEIGTVNTDRSNINNKSWLADIHEANSCRNTVCTKCDCHK